MTDNVIDLVDQAAFLGEQATGATSIIQTVWTYDRAVDIAGLRRFHRHLSRGRLSRRIKRSPLPFGRHRWISPGRASLLEIARPLPRSEFDTWLREQAETPLDVQRGPGWHLAVLPFTDGGTGISLVTSHTLTDGGGLTLALTAAVAGRDDEIQWERSRSTALADLRQFLRDLPGIGRAAVAAVRLTRRTARTTAGVLPGGDGPVTIPMTSASIDLPQWDARARELGGTSNSLLIGVATRLAQRLGRVGSDGTVDLTMPVDDRKPGDTRANAITNVDFTIRPPDPTDLSGVRAAVKQALIRHRDVPNERWTLLPLAPLLPKWLVRRMVGASVGSPTSVVSSNLGDLDPAVTRPDGTRAASFTIRTLGPGLTASTLNRFGGMLVVASGRVAGRIFISVLSYQPGAVNTDEALCEHLSGALHDFALAPTTVSTMRRTA